MSTRSFSARVAAAALAGLLAVVLPADGASAAATTTAKLRVLTPSRVLDPGTTYIVDSSVTVPTRPQADCLGPPGGSGAEYSFRDPVALSVLATAGRTTRSVRPLSLSDQFGFGLVVCGIGGVEAGPSQFWYLKHNHREASVGADQLRVENGDEVLFFLAQDNFPAPNPAELELRAPVRARPGEPVAATVIEHACVTDQSTFEVECASRPAAGATVSDGDEAVSTGPDGVANLTLSDDAVLVSTRGDDIPSEALGVCVRADLSECPPRRGERIVGSPRGERIKTTKGADLVRARGGADRIDLRRGGADVLNCGRGRDRVLLKRPDRDDRIGRNCERVQRG